MPLITEEEIHALPDSDLSVLGDIPNSKPSGPLPKWEGDEISLGIDEKGNVTLGDDPVAREQLSAALKRLKAASEKKKHRLLVTLVTQEQTQYRDITFVLDQLSKAGIADVTFTVGSEDEKREKKHTVK